tara:strand:- start:901 stop:1134 length:234 start_codon:yes stop_codon:yes gene_type:complete
MVSWFVVTLWFEYNNKLHMQHHSSFTHDTCKSAAFKIIEDFKTNNSKKTIKAVKCNDPVTWFKKYRLNDWDQVKDKE